MQWNEALQIFGRSVCVYLVIVFFIRIFGKKELAQLSIVDLIFILLISNSVQNAMLGPDTSLMGGLIAAAALFTTNYLFKYLFRYIPYFNKLVQGEPIILIYNGQLKIDQLNSIQMTLEEIEAAVREHGVENIRDVDLAVFEVDGNISVLSHNYTHRSKQTKRKIKPTIKH
jgi:uncharacterized membrane protein YcaP (DUF421 family)